MPPSDDPALPRRYQALALQVNTISVAHLDAPENARAQILANIDRVGACLSASVDSIRGQQGNELRLVVLPEYSLTGAPAAGSAVAWRRLAAFHPDGAEYAALATIAADQRLYLAGNAYEADPHFPDLYFQCSFVIGPDGTVVLRYRRLISLYSPSPYDVWDRYLEIYGLDGVFPVADTPIGRLAAVASEEILYPEIARCHVLRGAEVLLHSTSEMGSPRPTTKELARRARAAENIAYLVSANTAGVPAAGLPARSSTGMSKIVDYEGCVLAESPPGGESTAANATIDIAAVRARRRQAGLSNTLVRLPVQAWADSYAGGRHRNPNELAGITGPVSREVLNRLQQQSIERLQRAGLI